jgi:hypothetical protein
MAVSVCDQAHDALCLVSRESRAHQFPIVWCISMYVATYIHTLHGITKLQFIVGINRFIKVDCGAYFGLAKSCQVDYCSGTSTARKSNLLIT